MRDLLLNVATQASNWLRRFLFLFHDLCMWNNKICKKCSSRGSEEVTFLYNLFCNYTLYQNADWLMKGVFFFFFFLPILSFFQLFCHWQGICLIITLHRDACNKICKTLSVVRFIAKSYLPFLPFTETLVTKFVKRYQLCVLCNITQ